MQYSACFDTTRKWASREEIAQAVDLAEDGWCYVVSQDAKEDELVYVHVLSAGTILYGSQYCACVAQTKREALDRLCELVGFKS